MEPAKNDKEKEITKCCKNFFSNISQYMNKEEFEKELKKMISNPGEVHDFFKFLSTKSVPIDKQIMILNHPFSPHFSNCYITSKLFSTKKRIKNEINYDNPTFIDFIKNFLSIRGNPAVASDFLRIIQNNHLMSDRDLKLFCDSINWVGEKYPKKVLRELGLPASIGWMTKKSIASYTKVEFPIGYPKRSGQEKRHSILCNFDWVACECQSEDSHRHTPIIQVNEMLEGIEDRHSYLDIQIERNTNVLVYFLTKGKKCTGFPSQMVLNEMNEIYGKGGSIILELYKRNPEKYQPIIIDRLRQRGINLRTERLHKLEHFATDLEKILPTQRSKYQSAQSIKNAFPNFSEVGKMPIQYEYSNIGLIGQLVDIYIDIYLKSINGDVGPNSNGYGISSFEISHFSSDNLSSGSETSSNSSLSESNNSELDQMKQLSRVIMSQLRDPPDDHISTSFAHAASICTAAMLTNELDVVKEIDERTKTGVKVAVEIGITQEMLHGHRRLFKIAIETLLKKKWTDGAREMSGMFFEINLTKAIRIIRTVNLFIKCLHHEASAKSSEPNLIFCNFSDNNIIISFEANPDFAACLDLTRFEL